MPAQSEAELTYWLIQGLCFVLFFALLGFELWAYTLSHFTSPFCDGIFFKIGTHELFAWAGFEPQSS
jgi:hypothetical protein